MESVWLYLDGSKLLLADLDPFRVFSGIQLALNAQSGFCGGSGDQVDDHFMAHQRLAKPVLRDEREQPMLDAVPFAGTRRKMANRDRQPGFVCQFLQLQFSQPHSRPVAGSAVRGNEKLTGSGVRLSTHHIPPSPDTLNGKRGRVMIGSDPDPARILPQIVNSIGDSFCLAKSCTWTVSG